MSEYQAEFGGAQLLEQEAADQPKPEAEDEAAQKILDGLQDEKPKPQTDDQPKPEAAQPPKTAKPKTPEKKELDVLFTPRSNAGIVRRLLAELEAGKKGYAESDRMLQLLLSKVATGKLMIGEQIPLAGGMFAKLEDNFLDRHGEPKNKCWKPCGVNRYDLKIEHAKK